MKQNSCDAIRLSCIKFGAIYSRRLKRKHRDYGDTVRQAQRFLSAHAAVGNQFNLGRHLVRAGHYRDLRTSALGEWSKAVA